MRIAEWIQRIQRYEEEGETNQLEESLDGGNEGRRRGPLGRFLNS